MTAESEIERSERLGPWLLGLLAGLLMVLARLGGAALELAPALSSSIDVVGILVGFLAAVRALLPRSRFNDQSGLSRRISEAFSRALLLGFLSLGASLGRQLMGNPSTIFAGAADAAWVCLLVAAGRSAHLALSTAFVMLSRNGERASSETGAGRT